jgi:hypothetical protein
MALKLSIEELVDRLISGVGPEEEINKRRPKPFRYLTDKDEIKTILSEENTPVTMMTTSNKPKIVDDFLTVTGLGDVETIENVIKKHQASRKINR